jgi:hypothetical protein
MARIGVSITKSTLFRGATQEFSNVYYYEVDSLPSVSQADTIIDNIVAKEKLLHSTQVTFVRGRCWSQVGSPSQNNMISQKNLSGAGSSNTTPSFDKERAYLFRLKAGVDSRGNPVYLRKWYHSCGFFPGGITLGSGQLDNTSGFSSADRATMVNQIGWIGDANGSPLLPRLCSKNGRLPDAGATWSAHQYLEHHQLGDMWRAN